MITMRNILRKILIAVFALFIALPAFAASANDDNDLGHWATESNRELVTSQLTKELKEFGPTATPVNEGFVPIEAKVGVAFIGGLAHLGVPLDRALTRFAIIFILIAYAFWVAFEAYNLIGAKTETKETIKNVVIKGLIISGWIIVLNFGIVRLFSAIMIPIISLGVYISHLIWQGIAEVAGYSVPDTCEAIKNYAATNISDKLPNVQNEVVSSGLVASLKDTTNSSAGILCIPTQLSAFFVTIIELGWKWVVGSIGVSLLAFILGLYITYLGLKSIWKFMFITLGVVADIFMSLLLLPFTAVAETIAKTSYKGVAGDIFNSFLEIFKTEKLETQINRIIKALLYFICLGITVGVAVALFSFIIDPHTGKLAPAMDIDGMGGVLILILALLLVCYLADKAQKLAEDWGGKLDNEVGDRFKKDMERLLGLINRRKKTGKKSGNGANSASGGNGGAGGNGNGSGSQNSSDLPTVDIAIIGLALSGKYSLFYEITTNRTQITKYNKTIRYGDISTPQHTLRVACLPRIEPGHSNDFLTGQKGILYLCLIDATEPDWANEYDTITNELKSHKITFVGLVVITKTDLISPTELNNKIAALSNHARIPTDNIIPVSTTMHTGIDDLINKIDRVFAKRKP